MILSPIQAFGDGYGFYLNKTRFPLKSVAGMTKNGVLQEALKNDEFVKSQNYRRGRRGWRRGRACPAQ
ncbi:MAG: hypothetical protein D4R73_00075 [Deltaproteobacteria bacterium]|nr:MAG: hypothetical protein D4R73_00075 [Deltaproteobacteria bacterium]